MKECTPLQGLRRELTREMFEDLAALQCEIPEILGYVGTTEEKLARWCRKNYRLPLEETLIMLRQDGLIEIRRASFEQLKKSATLIQQQFNRFLSGQGDKTAEAERLAREIFSLDSDDPQAVRSLFERGAGGESEEES